MPLNDVYTNVMANNGVDSSVGEIPSPMGYKDPNLIIMENILLSFFVIFPIQ
jgi:hypothetical protein